jgi:hypothetical protein
MFRIVKVVLIYCTMVTNLYNEEMLDYPEDNESRVFEAERANKSLP